MGQNATSAATARASVEGRHSGTSARRATASHELSAMPYRRQTSVPVALLVGFVAGSVFWHFIGFWDFVGRIVFHKPKVPPAISGPSRSGELGSKSGEQLTAIADVETDIAIAAIGSTVPPVIVPAAIANCTTLIRDAVTGLTMSVACPADSVPERFGTALRRGDRARVADGTTADAVATARTAPLGWSTVTSSSTP